MQILTIQTKFEGFERDSKHSYINSNHSKGIRSIRMQIRTIQSIQMQIPTIQKAFERKLKPFEMDSKH